MMTRDTSGRDDRIDALRGLALFGILLVNIQSFLWGGTNPAGYVQPDATAADRVVFFATVTFLNLKFMPLFAMLFGVGFALLLDKLASVTSVPHAVFRRRLGFLFVFGLLHGVFFYYGDITHMYAVAGLVLLLYADRDIRSLGKVVVMWWCGAVLLTLLLTWAIAGNVPHPVEAAAEVQGNYIVFVEAGYLSQLSTRLDLFLDIVLGNLIGLPLTVALMLTGMLAYRSGWLARRTLREWRGVLTIGLALGLPAALVYGALLYFEADTYGLGAYSVSSAIPGIFSVSLSFAYAVAFLVRAPRWAIRFLAAPGRMPLTNYLLQSVAMGAVLSGWGLALGPRLGYAETAVMAIAIFTTQALLSHGWLAYVRQGPLEQLWRRWTYHRLPPPIENAPPVVRSGG
jgi:uncharacterized protein